MSDPSLLKCTRCGGEKPADQFHRDASRPYRQFRQSYCKTCVRIANNLRDPAERRRNRRLYEERPEVRERVREQSRAWKQSAKGRACEARKKDDPDLKIKRALWHLTKKLRRAVAGGPGPAGEAEFLARVRKLAGEALSAAAMIARRREARGEDPKHWGAASRRSSAARGAASASSAGASRPAPSSGRPGAPRSAASRSGSSPRS